MPTTDPVKRRKQNCENQKRWRQRQIDELRKLRVTLEKRDLRVKDLEAESGKLQAALQDALAEISHLRRNGSHGVPVPVSASAPAPAPAPRDCFSTDRQRESRASGRSTFSVSLAENTRPLVELVEVEVNSKRADSRSKALGPDAAPFQVAAGGSVDSDGDWQSIVIADDDPGCHQPVLSMPFHLARHAHAHAHAHADSRDHDYDHDHDAGSIPPTLRAGEHHPAWSEELTSRDIVPPIPAQIDSSHWLDSNPPIPAPPVPDANDDADEAPAQEVSTFHYNADPTQFDWTNVSMLGGTKEIWQRMMDFPDSTRISKHICAVQNVLWGVFPQLVARPPMDRERLVAGAFAWLISECWPSTEDCFKLMTVYRHIYNFELWRSFPCKATHDRLHPMYRPTALQLSVPHSPAIDWLPWPALRDKAIQMQNQLDVDKICMMALEHTVIQPRLPPAQGPTRGRSGTNHEMAFRVWDMYLLERAGGSSFSSTSMTHQPTSPNLQALVKAYDLPVQDIEYFRIDAPFFSLFPDMFIPGCASRSQTTPLEVPYAEHLVYPTDLTAASVQRLHKRVQECLSGAYAEPRWAV